MPRPRSLVGLIALAALVPLAVSCSAEDRPLPDGPTLVAASAKTMAEVKTTHMILEIEGAINALPVKRAESDVTSDGDASGNIQVLVGLLTEFEFRVLGGDDLYLKGATGGWAKQESLPYDVTAILDPDRGVAKLLETATAAKAEAWEGDNVRVAVNIDTAAATTLVPGGQLPNGITGKLWIEEATKRMVKAVLTIPVAPAPGTVTVELSNINAPVTVSAP